MNTDASTSVLSKTPALWENSSLRYLIGQAFFMGLAFGLLYNVAYTLLVIEFGSAGLRTVYVLVGVTVPLVTVGFNYLEEHLPLSQLTTYTVGFFAVAFFLLYLLAAASIGSWVIYLMMVINTMGALYCMMLRGAQAAELYDARAIKKNYPRITGGEIFAVVLAGILIGPLTTILGSLERLLILGGVSMLGALVFVRLISVKFLIPEERLLRLTEHDQSHHDHGFGSLLKILTKRYTLLVFAYQLISSAASLLVQYLVYSEARYVFPASAEFSQFLGLVKAGTTGLSFLFLVLVAGRLLMRFGMPLGLAGSPLGVGFVLIAALVAGFFEDGSGRAFFILIVASQFIDYMLYSGFTKTSVQSAFQPLHAHEREAVHTFAQGIGIPLSYGITGVALMLFARFAGFRTEYAVYLTLAVIVICGLVGAKLYKAYGVELRRSLSRRRIDAVDLSLDDASTMQILEKLLESDDSWQTRSALTMLEEGEHESYPGRLLNLIRHDQSDVRRDVLERIERLGLSDARDAVMERISRDDDPVVVAAAIRTACSLVDEPATVVGTYLDSSSAEIRGAAVAGLFLHGGINGILRAGDVFNRLANSERAADRVEAAHILERVAIRNFYHPLVALLEDESSEVVVAALRAARAVAHSALIPYITRWIDPVATRAEALSALIALGDEVEVLLDQCLTGTSDLNKATVLRIVRACSRISGSRVLTRLVEALGHDDPDIEEAVYAALAQRGYGATPNTRPRVLELILRRSNDSARILMALGETTGVEGIEPLNGALRDAYRRSLEIIFLLLTFLYDTDEVLSIRRKIIEGSKKERALGFEFLDVSLSGDIRQRVLTVVEHPEDREPQTAVFEELFGIRRIPVSERVSEILEDQEKWPQLWLRVCAHHAAWVLTLSGEKPEDAVLTTIERVIALKAADIFTGIPDNVLAHIASIGEDVEIRARQPFITQGEIGNCMYIIREGKVAVHDETTTFAELGPGAVVGEMAVLDPEPRSASVTAMEETLLLKIEKDAFDSVMVDHPGIANGVIQVLCRRLRTTLKKSA